MGDAHCDPEAGTPGFGAVSYNNHDGGGDGDGGDGGDGDGDGVKFSEEYREAIASGGSF